MHADTPRFRESGDGLLGIHISGTKSLTTGRMTRILRALGVTPSQHGFWTGLTLAEWIKTNPSWRERRWYELVVENLELIRSLDAAPTE